MKRMSFGLIGYGAWGLHHARVIKGNPDAVLTAIVARTEASRGRAQADHPEAHVYADYREMLQRESLDAVAVVLPTDLHYEASKAVLESGRHLLLEKPMALRLDHCDELIALAQAKKLVLALGLELRWSTLWGRAKELLDDGAIGEPLYVLIELWRRPYRLGADGWRYDLSRVGDWILEEPIHFFDLARWYLGRNGEPVSVYARANGKRADHPELQDNFSAIVNFPQGRYAVIAQTLAGWEHHQTVKVTGSDGALWASWSGATDRTFHPTFWLKRMQGPLVEDIPIAKPTGEVFELETQLAGFIRAVREGMPPAATGHDGRWAVAMCLKAQESVRKDELVQM